MDTKLNNLMVMAALAWILSAAGSAFAQTGGYGGQWWSGQQGMMNPGNMMNQGRMMVPGNMMGQGGMMAPGAMMGQGGMMAPGGMMGQGGMMGPGSMLNSLSQQQREQMKKITQEFFPKFGELQGQMMANQQRMRALFLAEEMDQAELDSIAGQMGNLMAEMFKLRVQHMDRMRSVIPQELRQQMRQ